MARSSHDSRRALPWAIAQRPRPLPRVVRLGRPANDNARLPTGGRARMVVISFLLALAAFAVAERLF